MRDHTDEGQQGGHNQDQPGEPSVLGRRGFLVGGLSMSTAMMSVAAACDSSTSTPDSDDDSEHSTQERQEPDPDHALLADALAAEQEIVSTYRATITTHPDLAELLQPLLRRHHEHATYLSTLERRASSQALDEPLPTPQPLGNDGADSESGSDESRGRQTPSTEGEPTDSPPVPDTVDEAIAALLDAERTAADDRLAEVARARSGPTARVTASIGACEASHAVLLEQQVRSA